MDRTFEKKTLNQNIEGKGEKVAGIRKEREGKRSILL